MMAIIIMMVILLRQLHVQSKLIPSGSNLCVRRDTYLHKSAVGCRQKHILLSQIYIHRLFRFEWME